MGRFTTFDHTADLGLRIEALELDDLFRTAAEGLFSVIVTHPDHIQPVHVEEFQLRAESVQELLADWLNELIFRCETMHLVFSQFELHVDHAGASLQGWARGEALDPERHGLDHEVKAATHHGLCLVHEEGGWIAEVILDI